MKRVCCMVLPAVFAVIGGAVMADTITINGSSDVWIREFDPDATYENDWISVASAGSVEVDGNNRRYGLVEFDISSVTDAIVGAHLELYAMDYNANDAAFSQQAGLLVPAGITSTTWNNLWTTKTEIMLTDLGFMDYAAGAARATWCSSRAASANDVSALNDQRTDTGMVTMMLACSGSRHEWGDGYAGYAPRLVLDTVPEPCSFIMFGIGLLGLLAYAWRKKM